MQDGGQDTKAQQREQAPSSSASYSRRATLIFLGSIGVTLLVTGATGSRMLKRATNKTSTVPHPVPSAPVPFPKRSPRRLKDLFAITPATVPNDEHSLSKLDFRTNQQFVKSIAIPSASAVRGSAVNTDQAVEEDPAMGAIVDAVKAFGIATFMLLGGTALVGYLLARRFESTSVSC